MQEWYELRSCGCQSWFCPRCTVNLGVRLRERLQRAVADWPALQMWTLTVDPTLFDAPIDSMRHLKAERCVARLVREMRRKGWLLRRDFFCVIEFHKSGWPHLHLLVAAKYVPHAEVQAVWDRFRPRHLPPNDDPKRPGFGIVRFSAPKFKSAAHAVNYAAKYLTKAPEEGFPAWVMDSKERWHRYSVSRGFWGQIDDEDEQEAKEPECKDDHPEDCFCEECRGEEKPRRTHRERVARCGRNGVIVLRREEVADDLTRRVSFRFVADPPGTFNDLCKIIERPAADGAVRLDDIDLAALMRIENGNVGISPDTEGDGGAGERSPPFDVRA